MPKFEVRFLKVVSGDTGHEQKVCQRTLEVDAECWAGALLAAREHLCAAGDASDWMRYADAIEMERLERTASLLIATREDRQGSEGG